jgi:hypothetical protein
VVVGGLAVAIAVAGVSITQGMGGGGEATGKLKGCVDRGSGELRIVKGKCDKGERKLAWNKPGARGPQGAPGAPGETGPPGEQGARGSFDFDSFQGMQCDDGSGPETIDLSYDDDGVATFTC